MLVLFVGFDGVVGYWVVDDGFGYDCLVGCGVVDGDVFGEIFGYWCVVGVV